LQEILLKYNNWDDMLGKKLLIDIRGGCYTNVLKNMSDDDIWNDLGMNNVPLSIMSKIIPLDKTYEFVFVEDEVNIQHPVSKYYMKLDDLSINLVINLKWINWGIIF
jgi:hypothetical protein